MESYGLCCEIMHLGDIGDSFLSFSMRGIHSYCISIVTLVAFACEFVTCVAN